MISTRPQASSTIPEHIVGKFIVSENVVVRIFRSAIVVLCALVALWRLLLGIAYFLGGGIYKKDFLQVYVLTRAIREGANPYLDMPILVSRYVGINTTLFPHPTPYPASVGIMFLPLSLFSYEIAAVVWFGLEFACLIGSLILLVLPATRHLRVSSIAVLLILSLLYWPILDELQLANVNLVVLLIISAMRFALFKERRVVAGGLFGLSLLIKGTFWPIALVFILRKDWRTIISALVTSLVGSLVTGLVVGFDKLWTNSFIVIPTVAEHYAITPWNVSLRSLSTRIFLGLGASADEPVQMSFLTAPPLFNRPAEVLPFWFALVGLILLAAYVSLRSIKDMDALLATTICISILVSPVSWGYYLVVLLVPAAYVFTRLWKERFPVWKTNVAMLLAGFQGISLTRWIDLGIRVGGSPKGFVYEPGASAIPFWPGLFGLMVDVGIVSIICFLVYLGMNPTKTIPRESVSA